MYYLTALFHCMVSVEIACGDYVRIIDQSFGDFFVRLFVK